MNKKKLIRTIVLSYLVILAIAYGLSCIFVHIKDKIEYENSREKLESFFGTQEQYYSLIYYHNQVAESYVKTTKPVYYEHVDVWSVFHPEKELTEEEKSKSENDRKTYDREWGDVKELYELKSADYENAKQTGRFGGFYVQPAWSFNCLEKINASYGDFIFAEYEIFPYRIALTNLYFNSQANPDYDIPQIASILKHTQDSYINDEKSFINKNYVQQNIGHNSICSLFSANDYYRPLCYEELPGDIRYNIMHGLLIKKAKTKPIHRDMPMESSWGSFDLLFRSRYEDYFCSMHNELFKVYFDAGRRRLWYLSYNWVTEPKFHDKLRFNGIAFLILTATLIVLLSRINAREKKFNRYFNEPIKEQILRVCNPQQFMDPYDEKKVSISNDICRRTLDCEDDNIAELKNIRNEACTTLGVNFLEQFVIDALIKKINPKNFMKPYNPEKVEKANKLYSVLTSKNLNIDEFEEAYKIITNEF